MGMLCKPLLVCITKMLFYAVVTLRISDSTTENTSSSISSFIETLEGRESGESSFFQKTGIIENNQEEDSIFSPFGTLHTLEKLSFWANKEDDIVQVLKRKLTLIDEEIELISKYISDYEESSARAIAEANEPMEDVSRIVAASPILSHLMANRYSEYIQGLKKLFESSEYKDNEDESNRILEIDSYKTSKVWPGQDDLLVSQLAIIHIQESHHIHPSEISEGVPIETTFAGQFEAIHCAQMGMFALRQSYYALAVDWLELGIFILNYDENDDSISKDVIANMLLVAIQEHNQAVLNRDTDYNAAFRTFYGPTYPGEPPTTRKYSNLFYYEVEGKRYKEYVASDVNMHALCKNEEFVPIEIKSKLKCYRYHGGHPYYLLNPLNAEELSNDPPVIQFYNILTESLMQELIKVRGELHLSTVADHDFQDRTYSLTSRSSAGGIISWNYTAKIWDLTTSLTGLVGMEETQTVEYVYGRVYWHHFDAVLEFKYSVKAYQWQETLSHKMPEFEDRLATVLYYIDTPVAGGNTPFVDLGVSAYPIRGSAVFWLNLYRNGTARRDGLHGACPVLHGHKTILNQWITYRDNFRTFPCTLNPFE